MTNYNHKSKYTITFTSSEKVGTDYRQGYHSLDETLTFIGDYFNATSEGLGSRKIMFYLWGFKQQPICYHTQLY